MNALPCKHLRVKRLFIPDAALRTFAPSRDPEAVCQCWCTRTMTPVGRDEQQVNPRRCADPGRSCYKI